MPTRFKTQSKKNYGISPIKSGYEKESGTPDFYINSCGLEDVDTAIFNLFDKEIAPQVGKDETNLSKVPVIFAAGEKWSMLKTGRPVRDQMGSLILPLITIMRTDITQDTATDIVGRGINQQQGEIVIRRRLNKSDRDYQNLVNRLFLKNQVNLAVNTTDAVVNDQITVERQIGDRTQDKDIADGAYLKPNLLNNIFETIVVPAPQFYSVKYQVTVWTQYMQHSNQVIEKFISSFLPQSQSWRLDTQKGYWFVATVDGGAFTTESSFEDMSTSERFIKHNFVAQTPGAPVPLKRYVSSPSIQFKNFSMEDDVLSTEVASNKYLLGSDDPTLPLDDQQNSLDDQRNVGWRQQKVSPFIKEHNPNNPGGGDPNDPSYASVPRGYRFLKVKSKNAKGETAYTGYSLDDIE